MSYETKAGVAVSCSFLCLVGVVLSSKLWEGQAANAGTPAGQESAGTGATQPPPVASTVAPEAKVPNLKAPPGTDNVLQQVAGAGSPRPQSIENLFKDDDDPFQGTPRSDAAGGKNSVVDSSSAPPNVKTQETVGTKQPETQPTPNFAAGAGAAGTPDPKQAAAPSFDDLVKQYQKKAAPTETAGNSAANAAQNAVKAGNGIAADAQGAANSGGKSLDEMVLEAEKKSKELAAAQNPAADLQRAGPASADDFAKELKIQAGKAQGGIDPAKSTVATLGASTQPINNAAASLADQAGNSFNALNDPLKKTASGADAAGQQQINKGAAVLTGGAAAVQNTAGSANDILAAGKGVAAAGTGGMGAAGTGQPRFPANSTEGDSGQTEAPVSGSRVISPVALSAPTSQPDNQFAQLRSNQPAPVFQPPQPYGAKPEAAVQPMTVPVPAKTIPVQKDSWDDDLYLARNGDTFQSISANYYKSEKFGQALMLYNRDYDGQAAEGNKPDPAAIVPGQRIYVPPERILKRDYGSVIMDQPASATTAPVSRTPPSTAPVGATTGTSAEKAYRVRGGGEMFLTIARSTLGNEMRWPEIYKLNPSFDTTKFIPGGSVLRLPGDAKIDPADAP